MTPPVISRLLLGLLLRGPEMEIVRGDIEEGFVRRVDRWGERRARTWYRRQVLSSAWALRLGWARPGLSNEQRGIVESAQGDGMIGSVMQDLRHAHRSLRGAPQFAAVSVLTLALGVGAATAVFTVVDRVLLEPLPFDEAERLVGIWHTAPGMNLEEVPSAAALHFLYRDESRVFEDVGHWMQREATVTGVGDPEQVSTVVLTASLLALLRVDPLVGRRFREEDDTPASMPTALLSARHWRRTYAADPGILGSVIRVDGQPYEIIGVLPEWFSLPGVDPAIYLPLRLDRTTTVLADFRYTGVGRLLPGATLADATADVERMLPMAPVRFPGAMTSDNLRATQIGANLRPLKEDYVGDVGQVLWVLFGSVGIVLVVALANVANLFVVRAEGRTHEVAVRRAIGAGQGRIARHFLAESLLLGLMGGVLGLGLAFGGVRALVWMGPEGLPRLGEIALDGRVIAFAAGVAIAASLLWGIVMGHRHRERHVAQVLRSGAQSSRGTGFGSWTSRSLVVAQMAFALVLLVGSGLMLRSFQELRRVDPGFADPRDVLTFRVAVPPAEVGDPAEVALAFEDIWNRIAAIPGVASVGASSKLTMDGATREGFIWSDDRPISMDVAPPLRRFKWVTEGYFETMGNPVLSGRPITWQDIHDRARVAVVTRNFAEEYWGGPAAALGKRIATGDPAAPVWREIVGVVGDVHDDGVSQAAPTVVFWPHAWDFGGIVDVPRAMSFAIRASGRSATSLVRDVEEAVWAVDPNLPLANMRTLDAILSESMARTSFTMVMLLIAATVTLALGVVGIYGVVSYVVSRRTREIGIRIALGADRRDVRRMVLRQAALLSVAGTFLGMGAAVLLTRMMASLLYGVEPTDPATYVSVGVLMTMVALAASYLPARKASRTDPLMAFRCD